MERLHSAEAEQGVIGSLFFDSECADKLGGLKAEDFYFSDYRTIFAAMVAQLAEGVQPTPISVLDALNGSEALSNIGGLVGLNDLLFSVTSDRLAASFAKVVIGKAAERALIAALDKAKEISSAKGDTAEKAGQISALMEGLAIKPAHNTPTKIGDLTLERSGYYDALERGEKESGWRTHIPALTNRLGGGAKPGGLYILAARPGLGKSSFSEDLCLNFSSDGLTTLFLSLEMNKAELVDRAIANIGSVSYSKMLRGELDQSGWGRVAEAVDEISKRPFYLDDQPSLTLRHIREKAKQVKGLKILVIDYIQLTASDLKTENRNSQIEEVSRGLKALAKELQIAVIALAQLNREVDKRSSKRPVLSDLRDSGAIEQDADVVLFLWPVREYEDEGRMLIGCEVAKNRQGRIGDFGLDFYGDFQQWRESTESVKQQSNKEIPR